MKLDLTPAERTALRRAKRKQSALAHADPVEVARELSCTPRRARELVGLATFQSINSLGPGFARDLIDMGIFTLNDLRGRTGADLLDEHERRLGYTTDPCVEDQFRRVVHYAETGDNSRSWFDFTAERKAYREKHGYPNDRPTVAWHEVLLAKD